MKNKLLIVMLCLFTSGCSMTFMYNNIDWWIDWYVDDFVDLNRQQQKAFDAKITELHQWHRDTQLLRYAEHAKTFKRQVNEGITKPQLEQHFEQVRGHWRILINKLAPEVSQLMTQLTDEQKKSLVEHIKEQQKKDIEDYEELPRNEWQEKRAQESFDDLDEWFGRLTEEQKQQIKTMAFQYQSTFKLWVDYRLSWQNEFYNVLATKPDQVFVTALSELFIHGRDRLRSPEYKELSNQNNQIAIDIMHYVMTNLTEKQRKKFNRKMDNMIEDFIDLAEH